MQRDPIASKSPRGLQSADDKRVSERRSQVHGRVVMRRSVVEMARTVIVIRWSTDEHGPQTRVASKRVRVLQERRVRSDA